MVKCRKVALLIRPSRRGWRDFLRGIAAYARPHGPWEFYHQEPTVFDSIPKWLSNWSGDGIIIRIKDQKLFAQVRKLGIPTIDLGGLYNNSGIPSIDSNHASLSKLAVNHFIEQGFENFAFYGVPGVYYSDRCCETYIKQIREAGYNVDVFQCTWDSQRLLDNAKEIRGLIEEDEMAQWLKTLPKPVALMACSDYRAQQVVDICMQCGIVVPDEVAVVGVGNDEVICELSNPPMTSIDINAWKIGYDAAALLESIIEGESPPQERILVEPNGIIVRQSSSALAISDRSVAKAVHYIRNHACDGISVDDVLKQVRLSRSTLYRRFTEYVGHSPNEEIRRVQLQRIKQFLAETDYPLVKITRLVGMVYVQSMCYMFRAETGMTARQYRLEKRSEQSGQKRKRSFRAADD